MRVQTVKEPVQPVIPSPPQPPGQNPARAGDQNGDGYGDFLVGNPHDSSGGVLLFHGTYD
jgi:hypothetical protein